MHSNRYIAANAIYDKPILNLLRQITNMMLYIYVLLLFKDFNERCFFFHQYATKHVPVRVLTLEK